MSVIRGLKFMFYSRGIKQGMRRFLCVNRRFGLTPHRQMQCIRHYTSILEQHDVKGTFFIPAVLLAAYFKDIAKIRNDRIEWGIHCDIHIDLSKLNKEAQKERIANAIKIFDALKVPFNGFRAPYLRINNFTLEAIAEENRFLYDSSCSILWDEIYRKESSSYAWAENFYKPQLYSKGLSSPEMFKGLVKIPVTLPDDDMLVDRDGLEVNSILSIWKGILKISYEEERTFVLQLHPERIYDLDSTLDTLIRYAKNFNPPIWIASLGDVAEWQKSTSSKKRWPEPYKAALCITGDIDSITIFDFLNRLKKW